MAGRGPAAGQGKTCQFKLVLLGDVRMIMARDLPDADACGSGLQVNLPWVNPA
jgi:hypothetical protein